MGKLPFLDKLSLPVELHANISYSVCNFVKLSTPDENFLRKTAFCDSKLWNLGTGVGVNILDKTFVGLRHSVSNRSNDDSPNGSRDIVL